MGGLHLKERKMKGLEVEITKTRVPEFKVKGILEVEVVEKDYDWECTCSTINWEPTERGFACCPFCESYDGELGVEESCQSK